MTPLAQATTLAILDYWHKVEFFIPYGLEQYLDDLEEWQSTTLRRNNLEQTDADWLSIDVAEEKTVTGYNLFLGIFDKSQISRICESVLPPPQTASTDEGGFENEERTELEGMTCFAKLPLDRAGNPVIDAISISTTPWALGQTLSSGLQSLSHDAFNSAREDLIQRLRNFMSSRGTFAGQSMQAHEVVKLQTLLCDWAGFTPDDAQPIAVLTAKVKPLNGSSSEKIVPDESEKDDEEDVLEELDILNSFYIRDIERAIEGVSSGTIPPTLAQFLSALPAINRIDLYSEGGCTAILNALRPRFLNRGHWLAEADQSMSLMQQFALNQIRQETQNDGLFAVNGPPGTGKTTLLRDLFADNIVQRARILAGLAKADDAFVKNSSRVRFKGNSNTVTLRPLIDALTGFEMVVASTNNAAVENISVDLVKRKALGEHWRHCGYLQPVAHNIAAKEGKGGATSPQGDQMPWGLISCALGNSRNRRLFNERFSMFSLKTKSSEQPKRFWDWLKEPNPVSFSDARELFHQADKAVEAALTERERLAELLDIVGQGTEADYLASSVALIQEAKAHVDVISAALTIKQHEVRTLQQTLQQLILEQQLIDRSSPGFWARLLRTQEAKAYVQQRKSNALNQLSTHQGITALQGKVTKHTDELNEATRDLENEKQKLSLLTQQWRNWCSEHDQLRTRLRVPRLPTRALDLVSDEQLQIEGLWHDEELAQLRSALFAAALQLQQAWVHETAQKGGALGANLVAVNKVLSNQVPEDPKHTLQIWQNLFMVVPVVSSTFASFANQFRGLGPGSLGWVFIDEAGQAVPQAAVGALWRAKRCVVVGDPLQIEPVFTLPTPLIDALGKLHPVTADNAYAPHCVSVQRLADQANRFGAYASFMDENIWIGSPLRVHRRCHEPMFSLANRIAYDNKMVYGLRTRVPMAAPLIDLASGWVDIRGAVERKQSVPEQIEFMIKVIVSLFQRDRVLPELYVISPFKAIRQALREQIMQVEWQPSVPKRDELKHWIKRSIGTVHTFQGKEEKTVFMVLGTDSENAGGAQWASSKPNLINVALTRAQHRVYLVGDVDLWGTLPYFKEASRGDTTLPRWKRADFAVIAQKMKPDKTGRKTPSL
ncbi:ATP-binding protein [Pseudomonas sp. Seg1]|uniref:DEAD/DEAH box helicase n=1 Tax=Pseudomonas sp. Seg1 TaxID=2678259 RepID=UPI001BB3869C|nr:DEAD/DEAH box helicase [Pseudomonas sp. Seg1]BBP68304.1 ATP-binding protein [Pseudomonas sp. Seg1]